MQTRFDRFMSRRVLPKLVVMVYALFMTLAAYQINQAMILFWRLPWLSAAVYGFYILSVILVTMKLWGYPAHHRRLYRKAVSFVSCFSLYYVQIFLIWEVLCLLISPGESVRAAGILISVGASVLIVAAGYLNAGRITGKHHLVSLNNHGNRCKIVLVSDLHLGIFVNGAHMKQMVEKINAMAPDVVVIAGDLFDVDNALLGCPEELKEICGVLRSMQAKSGVYAVVGNHDPQPDDEVFREFLRQAGITLLDNEAVMVCGFCLAGRSEKIHGKRPALKEILGKSDEGKVLVVVDHRPEYMEEAVREQADLVLSGHTHRGQLFPVSLFIRFVSGKQSFYGHCVMGNTHGIITAGVGFFELPMRLGSSNEIAEIDLLF